MAWVGEGWPGLSRARPAHATPSGPPGRPGALGAAAAAHGGPARGQVHASPLNEYQQALRAVGEVVAPYDSCPARVPFHFPPSIASAIFSPVAQIVCTTPLRCPRR